MFEVNVKNVTEGRRRGPARVWGSDGTKWMKIGSNPVIFAHKNNNKFLTSSSSTF